MGLPGLSLDENNHCVLLFDDKVVLNMELNEEKELLIIYSYLGEVPFEGRENIFESLLESNLFWKDTQGATIGIDVIGSVAEGGNLEVILSRAG